MILRDFKGSCLAGQMWDRMRSIMFFTMSGGGCRRWGWVGCARVMSHASSSTTPRRLRNMALSTESSCTENQSLLYRLTSGSSFCGLAVRTTTSVPGARSRRRAKARRIWRSRRRYTSTGNVLKCDQMLRVAAVLQQDVVDAVYSHEGPHVLWAVEVYLLQFCR